ncbi:MAG: hypothetical protein ABSH49_20155 [Bryobacteraceae bacterium]|jgi:hypothetical protein
MDNWPRLPEASVKAIELAEKEAESALRNNLTPYTPRNPRFRPTADNLRESGCRVIDYICSYAETLFDAMAKPYAGGTSRSIAAAPDVFRERVAPEVKRKACIAWDGWLLFTATEPTIGPPVGPRAPLPGDIRFEAPRDLQREGIEEVVISFTGKESDPKLGAVLLELQHRFQDKLQNLLETRICDWDLGLDDVVPPGSGAFRAGVLVAVLG